MLSLNESGVPGGWEHTVAFVSCPSVCSRLVEHEHWELLAQGYLGRYLSTRYTLIGNINCLSTGCLFMIMNFNFADAVGYRYLSL